MGSNVVNTHHQRYPQRHFFKYPKFTLLLLTLLVAYFIFYGKTYLPLHDLLISLGFFGIFIAGMLYAYGFTALPATAVLLILSKDQNIVVAGLIAGFGALIADLLIFKFIRSSFKDEVDKMFQEKIVRFIGNHTPNFLKKYLVPVLAGFIIAAPLPDEIGVTLMAADKSASTNMFLILSYGLNTIGILVILKIGSGL